MIDAVLTSDHSPLACGTVKWSQELARRLGLPCYDMRSEFRCGHPLLSVRATEWRDVSFRHRSYDVVFHDWSPTSGIDLAVHAEHVYAANPEIAAAVRPYRPDVEVLWAPSSLWGLASRGTLDVLSFGFAHKYQAVHFERLKAVLDRTPGTYTISLSTGIHEGRSWDQDFTDNMTLMRGIFGEHLRCLGFVADDGLARLLKHVNAVAMFYEPGVRANNTSFWAAMESGVPTITNLDAGSPPELQHAVNCFDIAHLTAWPDAEERKIVRSGAAQVVDQYSWDRLIQRLTVPVAV